VQIQPDAGYEQLSDGGKEDDKQDHVPQREKHAENKAPDTGEQVVVEPPQHGGGTEGLGCVREQDIGRDRFQERFGVTEIFDGVQYPVRLGFGTVMTDTFHNMSLELEQYLVPLLPFERPEDTIHPGEVVLPYPDGNFVVKYGFGIHIGGSQPV